MFDSRYNNRRFVIGSMEKVIRKMATCAIRDQEALIDANTPAFGDPDDEELEIIHRATDCIVDFEKIRKLASKMRLGRAPRKSAPTLEHQVAKLMM